VVDLKKKNKSNQINK